MKSLTKVCRDCGGCNRMEREDWTEPDFCPSSPDPDRQHVPEQMRLDVPKK